MLDFFKKNCYTEPMKIPFSTTIFLLAAKELNLKVKQIRNTPIYKIKKGRKKIHFTTSRTSPLSVIGYISCSKKNITKNFLKKAKISTPKWREFYKDSTIANIKKYAGQLRFPVVIKPFQGTHGNDVTVGVQTVDQVVPIVQKLQQKSSTILVEEMIKEGDEIRLVATRRSFLAATMRRPASVVGDGERTVRQLIRIKNSDPNRHNVSAAPMQTIKINNDAKKTLAKQGLKLESIPKKDQRVYLRQTSNICQGGDSIDITNKIHPSIKKIAVKAVKAIPELPFAGVDFMTKDFTKKQTKNSYSIIEINHNPMINMHYQPFEGKSRNVAYKVLKEYFDI